MLELLRGWLLFFIRPFHQNPPFRPILFNITHATELHDI